MNITELDMSDCILRVEKLENGYEVEVIDEKIVAQNAKPKSAWKDPWKGYAFENADSALEFIQTQFRKLKPPPSAEVEFDQAFKSASAKKD